MVSCLPLSQLLYSLISPSRRLNTSPNTVEDKDILKLKLTNPPVKKIDLHFPLGLEVTARNLKGVTIKDALEAIHKQFKKKVPFSPPASQYKPLTKPLPRPMMSWKNPTSLASSGTRKSAGHGSLCTKPTRTPHHTKTRVARNPRRRRRTKSRSIQLDPQGQWHPVLSLLFDASFLICNDKGQLTLRLYVSIALTI